MRKFLFLLLFFILPGEVFGATLKMTTELLDPFCTTNPPPTVRLRVVGDYVFNEKEKIQDASVFLAQVTHISQAKRGRRDGYFYLRLISYTAPDGKDWYIQRVVLVKARQYKPLDKKEAVLDAGASVAGFFVKNISYPINFARGALSPQDGKTRVASGTQMMYEKSLATYISKGEELSLNKGDYVTLVFKYNKK